ncbi:hypothetical protein QUA32_24625 [Microcoleus sp. Pol14D6]|uniref:hypothetical protein n=1 Tax=Microcoleus sp. Pol14C2 TaxID=3055397 RepID=UPI002FD636D0
MNDSDTRLFQEVGELDGLALYQIQWHQIDINHTQDTVAFPLQLIGRCLHKKRGKLIVLS